MRPPPRAGGFCRQRRESRPEAGDPWSPAPNRSAAFVPLARQLPPKVASYIPEDTKSLVRLNGVASVLGGLGFATGIFRRGATSLAANVRTAHVIDLYPSTPPTRTARSIFVRATSPSSSARAARRPGPAGAAEPRLTAISVSVSPGEPRRPAISSPAAQGIADDLHAKPAAAPARQRAKRLWQAYAGGQAKSIEGALS